LGFLLADAHGVAARFRWMIWLNQFNRTILCFVRFAAGKALMTGAVPYVMAGVLGMFSIGNTAPKKFRLCIKTVFLAY
jgi:hypothetical protein